MEDDLGLFCESRECVTFAEISEAFGSPQDVAANFYTGLDAKNAIRYSYSRMKVTYVLLAVILIVALTCVGFELFSYIQARIVLESAHSGNECTIKYVHGADVCPPESAADCTVFTVRTQQKGIDYYWDYHSCTNRFYLILPPEEWNGPESYAQDIYVKNNGGTTHWRFDEKHSGWYKIYDEE